MTEKEIHETAKELVTRFDKMGITGPGWSGDARRGFMFNPEATGRSRGGGGTPPIIPTGACCYPDGSCAVTTAAYCSATGGTYQGDTVPCEDVECPVSETGACCEDDCNCTVTTRDDCPGLWLPGADCDPNPCPSGWYCSLYELQDSHVTSWPDTSQAYCDSHSEFWSHDNCFGGEHVLEICTGTNTIHCEGPPTCHIEQILEVQMDGTCDWTTISHEPPDCVCNCPVCICACGPDDCCFFENSVFEDCGDSGFVANFDSGADCENGFGSGFQTNVECHYPC